MSHLDGVICNNLAVLVVRWLNKLGLYRSSSTVVAFNLTSNGIVVGYSATLAFDLVSHLSWQVSRVTAALPPLVDIGSAKLDEIHGDVFAATDKWSGGSDAETGFDAFAQAVTGVRPLLSGETMTLFGSGRYTGERPHYSERA